MKRGTHCHNPFNWDISQKYISGEFLSLTFSGSCEKYHIVNYRDFFKTMEPLKEPIVVNTPNSHSPGKPRSTAPGSSSIGAGICSYAF